MALASRDIAVASVLVIGALSAAASKISYSSTREAKARL